MELRLTTNEIQEAIAEYLETRTQTSNFRLDFDGFEFENATAEPIKEPMAVVYYNAVRK